VRQGLWLERATIAWNLVACAASIVAGILAGSVALVAFGSDSAIELVSAVALLRHLPLAPTRRTYVLPIAVMMALPSQPS
jgi:divalent metal cation (Fe/Co/Zn/Cd) transporter